MFWQVLADLVRKRPPHGGRQPEAKPHLRYPAILTTHLNKCFLGRIEQEDQAPADESYNDRDFGTVYSKTSQYRYRAGSAYCKADVKLPRELSSHSAVYRERAAAPLRRRIEQLASDRLLHTSTEVYTYDGNDPFSLGSLRDVVIDNLGDPISPTLVPVFFIVRVADVSEREIQLSVDIGETHIRDGTHDGPPITKVTPIQGLFKGTVFTFDLQFVKMYSPANEVNIDHNPPSMPHKAAEA